jgi:Cysteine rich repeat
MRRSWMRGLLIVAIVLGLSPGAAFAQTMAERMACRDDFSKYCKGVQPGGGRVIACLGKYEGKLSAACKKVVDAHK